MKSSRMIAAEIWMEYIDRMRMPQPKTMEIFWVLATLGMQEDD